MAPATDDLRPGLVRVFKPGHSLVLTIGIWAEKNDVGVIQIHMTGDEGFHTTVTNQTTSDRFHRTLFRNLRRTLERSGLWPFGEEGLETEEGQ